MITAHLYCPISHFHTSATSSPHAPVAKEKKGKADSLGHTSYDQAKSALHHLFQMSKYKISIDLSEKLKLFMKGMKWHVAAKKMEDGDSQIIGKKKMDFKVYEKICEFFMKEEGKEFIFSCCFLTLEWNLMAWLENIVYAHLYHITWEDDCLVFHLAQVWHVYATPNNPTTCPVLALACYIFSNPGITDRHNLSESDEVMLDEVGQR